MTTDGVALQLSSVVKMWQWAEHGEVSVNKGTRFGVKPRLFPGLMSNSVKSYLWQITSFLSLVQFSDLEHEQGYSQLVALWFQARYQQGFLVVFPAVSGHMILPTESSPRRTEATPACVIALLWGKLFPLGPQQPLPANYCMRRDWDPGGCPVNSVLTKPKCVQSPWYYPQQETDQVWWCMPVLLALRTTGRDSRLSSTIQQFNASPSYRRPWSKWPIWGTYLKRRNCLLSN